MPTEIRIIVSDDPIGAMQKFAQTQKGKYRFNRVERSEFVVVELHRPQQITLLPDITEVTLESPIDQLCLSTQIIKALRHAQKCVFKGMGRHRHSDVVRDKSMDIVSIGQLLEKTEADLLGYFDIGPKRVAEVNRVLALYNQGFALKQVQLSLPNA